MLINNCHLEPYKIIIAKPSISIDTAFIVLQNENNVPEFKHDDLPRIKVRVNHLIFVDSVNKLSVKRSVVLSERSPIFGSHLKYDH